MIAHARSCIDNESFLSLDESFLANGRQRKYSEKFIERSEQKLNLWLEEPGIKNQKQTVWEIQSNCFGLKELI